MSRKGKNRFRALALLLALLFPCLIAGAASPEVKKASPEVKKAAPEVKKAAPEVNKATATAEVIYAAPKITRLATFQNVGGEKLLYSPLALARDVKNGDLFITSFGSGELIILDAKGFLVNKAGREVGLTAPYGVALDETGRIYLSEVQTGLLKVLSPGGALMDRIDLSLVVGRPVSPGRITIGQDGRLYIADLRAHEILVFNLQGDFLQALGGFAYLQKAAVVNDKIIGLSAYGRAVHIFDQTGVPLLAFGDHGEASERSSIFSFPTGFAVDAKGRLWIADAFQHRLRVFSLDGRHLFNYGRLEIDTGGFFFPVDLCFGEKGMLYVLEKGAERIQIFQVSDL